MFASKCLGEKLCPFAALYDLSDPGWGDPGFPHCALLLPSLPCMALFVLVFLFVSALYLMAILEMAHKMLRICQELVAVPLFPLVFVCGFCLVW